MMIFISLLILNEPVEPCILLNTNNVYGKENTISLIIKSKCLRDSNYYASASVTASNLSPFHREPL